jgi:hypothetical protein
MSPFVWWIFPIVATLVASCWVGWTRRTRRPPSDADTVEAYERFRAALRPRG